MAFISFESVTDNEEICLIECKDSVTLSENSFTNREIATTLKIMKCMNVTLETQSLASMPLLKKVYILDSNISIIKGDSRNDCINVNEIFLSKNKIEKLESDFLSNFDNLTSIIIQDNQLPPNFGMQLPHLPKLEVIKLSDNTGQELTDLHVTGLKSLKSITIEGEITNATPSKLLANLPSLEEVDLKSFDLMTISADSLHESTNLRTLRISCVKKLPAELLRGLCNLEEILVSYVRTRIPENFFVGLTKLKKLELTMVIVDESCNKLLANLTSLEEVSLHIAHSENIPDDLFAGSTNLKKLKLQLISKLPTTLLCGLSNLEEISLLRIKENIPNNVFQGLTNLKIITMEHVQLEESSSELFANLPALEEINLQLDRAENIPVDLFAGSTNLKKLKIRNAEELPSELFRGLNNLEKIHLWGIKKEIPLNLFEGLSELKVVYLTDITLVDEKFRELITKLGSSVRVVRN